MTYARTLGGRIWYTAEGSGSPVIAIAGTGQDHTAWNSAIQVWRESFRMILFDNRDVGQSSPCDEYTVKEMAQDVLDLSRAVGLDRFSLVGISLGGAVAQEVALANPAVIDRLVLGVSWARTRSWMAARVLDQDPLRITRAWHLLSNSLIEQPPQVLARQIAAGRSHDAQCRLPSLEMPVLVVGSTDDQLVPPRESRKLADLIPGAKLAMLDEVSHNVERSPKFAQLVADFLLDPDPRESVGSESSS